MGLMPLAESLNNFPVRFFKLIGALRVQAAAAFTYCIADE
jgi:hypothetical protein